MLTCLYYKNLNYHPELLSVLQNNFDLLQLPTPQDDRADILEKVDVCFAPLGFPFNEQKINKCRQLKVIASNTTGTPHIDLAAAANKNIYVASLAQQSEFLNSITPTAEHTIGLMIAVIRRIPAAFQSVLDGQWNRWPFGAPKMLSRMSLGIVGLGRIGSMVAKQAEAIGMQVYFYDPYQDQHHANSKHLAAKKIDSLTALVEGVDVVSLHLPLNSETKNLFDADLFSRFKVGSYFINTARGGIVQNAALLDALTEKRLAGAALDVLNEEFDSGATAGVATHPLVEYARHHDHLLITPHIGGSTEDAWYLTQKHTIDLVLQHLRLGANAR